MRLVLAGSARLPKSVASRQIEWLLSTSALCTAALLIFGGGALAFDIDSGDVETVIGTGGGTQASPWVLAEDLAVGVSSTGTLTISDGGEVSNDTGFVGRNAGSVGTVTVTGAGSTWTSSGLFLFVGNVGTGTLTISDGGAVGNTNGVIGTSGAGTGTVTVTGAGSTWTNSGALNVGNFGDGTLTIESGGAVSNSVGFIGNNTGGTGTVTVTGAGSTWTNSSDLTVGNFGAGTLTIADGGTVTNALGVIAAFNGSTGTATVTGAGSTWTNAAGLVIGFGGTGTLTISDGGAVSNIDGVIGELGGSTGTVTVTGIGSTWTNSGDLSVGNAGTGTLTIADGGAVSNANGVIGQSASSTGTVTVAGAGSTWNNDSKLAVGTSGDGFLNVTGGGYVDSGVSLTVGEAADGVGTVTVSGAGSTLVNGFATFIGEDGIGTLTISNGGELDGSDSVFFGFEVGSEGTGTVTGSGSKLSGGIVVGRAGVGTLTVSDGGIVEAQGNLDIANSATGTGTLNIGAVAGDAAAAAGTLDAATIAFGPGTGTLNFNHTGTNYTLASDITGSGTLNHLAGVTNLTGDASGFSGTTTVSGGTLNVNNALGGDLNITGGAVGGSGTLGNLTVASGGTIAPGNSIGTLNVTDITFGSGSTYEVEVNSAGQSDRINVTNTATINGGTVRVIQFPDYALGTTYTIITAGAIGGVGTFDSATYGTGSLFITPTLAYVGNDVTVTLAQTADFADVAATPNQIAAAGGIQSAGSGAVFDAIMPLGSNAEAQAAFDAISGEIHASAKTALLEDSRFPREAAMDRLRAGAEDQVSENSGLWSQGFGAWTQWSSDGNAAAMDHAIGGFVIGADALVWDNARFGVLGGVSQSSISIDDRASSGTAGTYTLGAYGGGEWDAFTLSGGLAHSWHSIDTSRSADFTGFSDSLAASYGARTLQAWGEAAYGFETGVTRFEPFANLAHVRLSTDGFTESGGAAALSAAASVVDATFTTLGLRAETDVALGELEAKLSGMVGWRHAFGGTPNAQMAFASGGNDFTIAGVPLAQDSLVFDAGFEVNLSDSATLGLAYGGQVGSGLQNHGASINLNVKF